MCFISSEKILEEEVVATLQEKIYFRDQFLATKWNGC